MQTSHEFIRPSASLATPQWKIIVLEEKDADLMVTFQVQHFFYDFCGLTYTNDFARSSTVEGVNRTKRTAPCTTTAGQQRKREEAADFVRCVRPIGKRQGIKIRDQCSGFIDHNVTGIQVRYTLHVAPFASCRQPSD